MITIESAESALKNIYLDVVVNDINTKTNPFLTMINKNTKNVSGKEIKVPIRYGDSGNVLAGSETCDLPASTNSKYVEISVPLKNIYGTFQISDKAIRASQNNAGAFANLLSGEMQNLIAAAQANLNSMIYGNGLPIIGYTSRVNAATKTVYLPARFTDNINVGDVLHIYNQNNELMTAGGITVATVDKVNGSFTYSGAFSTPQIERFYLVKFSPSVAYLNGIDSLFLQDGKIYNADAAANQGIKPYLVNIDTSGPNFMPVITEDDVIDFMDGYEEHCQSNPADIILTHPNVRKALFENLKGTRSNIDVTEMAGGFKGFSFNGVPMYADVKCKGGTLYALNSDSWAMHQLCDWTWLSGDDGSILKQIDGKPAYNATLVKYADLVCEKPFLQGKATGYSVKRYKADQDAADYYNNRD